MGIILKVVNTLALLFFVIEAVGGPLYDVQIILSHENYPKFLANISAWYVNKSGDYMVAEKPNFIVGFVWFELLALSPLSLINIYGLISGKSWFKTTCLAHGVSLTTSMVAIIGELRGSGKAPNKLLNVYYFFMGLCILLVVRGLPCETPILGNKSTFADRKKRS